MNDSFAFVGHHSLYKKYIAPGKTARTGHAFLLVGPAHIGKSTFAAEWAKAWGGLQYDAIHWPESDESLKIAEVRQLNQKLSLSHAGTIRMVRIEAIERMPIEAQNALLKTLEEPQGNTLFLLTSHQPNQVLPTIHSRCQRIEMTCPTPTEIDEFLSDQSVNELEKKLMKTYALGRIGTIITWLKNPDEWAEYRATIDQVERWLEQNDLAHKINEVEALETNPQRLAQWIDAFYGSLRQRWRQNASTRWSTTELAKLFDVLEKTRYYLKSNVNKRLALVELAIATEK
ncbi:AAA family ATPase [Candidatus Peregrinibacteria bacterium]|nr:MAG: AAA family ATPase [Candidatus Peregrinibacteria bacterium]